LEKEKPKQVVRVGLGVFQLLKALLNRCNKELLMQFIQSVKKGTLK